MKSLAFLPVALALAACGSPEQRYAVPMVASDVRVSIGFASVEVRDIALPTYAQQEDIFIETADGALTSQGILWADDPSRASTLELTRALAAITGARAASEPWPFDDYAAARLEVRVEEFVASVRGEFRVTGQYFVAPDGGEGRNRAGDFRIAVPLSVDADGVADLSPTSIAAARSRAMSALAEEIARDGLR